MNEVATNIQFIEGVCALRQSNIETYKQPKRITADFRMEKATTKSYNGRQILELLQNCDDALHGYNNGECIVNIQLDTQKNTLRVSNHGAPFSIDGIGSLLIANTSSKGREFIGNKGLGFRSVLNWVHEIKLFTQGCLISFSKQQAVESFNKLVPNEDLQKTLYADNKEHLDKGEVPLAVLSMPNIVENNEEEKFSTSVELHYLKEKEEDIKKQLQQLNTKLLLFLNHIRVIRVDYVDENRTTEIKVNEEASNDELVVTNDGAWNIKDTGDIYFDKTQENDRYYRIKLAWKDNLSDTDSRFYTYFPTAVPTNLPFLIHATFDLDPTRNYLNTSDNGENQTILKHVAQLMKDTALSQLCKTPASWQPYIFLLPQSKNTNKLLSEFYDMLQNFRDEESIYPCVDDSYVSIDNAVFHGDDFSNWVLDNKLGDYFPRLVKAKDNNELTINGRYSFEEWENIIESINPLLSIEARTQLIGLLIKKGSLISYFDEIHSSHKNLPLLLDNSGEIVSSSKQVFTKDTEDISYELPSYIDDIAFISTKLYSEIKRQLADDINNARQDNETGPSRAIKRLLKDIVNIGSDDIIDVIDLIVKQTNRVLENAQSKLDTANEMLKTLFSIFLSNPDRRGKLTAIKAIPIITRNLTVKFANKLFFGKEYNSGVETEFIFDGVYDDDTYIAGADILGLDSENEEFFESFFLWLGVNEDVILEKEKREEHHKYENWNYAKFVSNQIKLPEKVSYYACNNFLKISNINHVKQLDVKKLFRLLIKNNQLFDSVLNDAEFYTKYGNEYEKPVHKAPSFIVYQLNTIFDFNTFIIDKNLPKIPEITQIDLDETVDGDIANKQVLLAKKLGVKTSFSKLPIESVINALKIFGEHSENASNSQEFYKLVNEYFKANEEKLNNWKINTTDIKYFSRKGGIGKDLQAIEAKDVFYSDNKLLPQKTLDKYWYINLPSRIGEKNISRFFGVELIKNVINDIKINVSKSNKLNEELGNYINKIKPYLLCYRLQSLKQNQSRKNEVNLLKPFVINLVCQAAIEFDNKIPEHLENYDFIPDGNTFILKCNQEVSLEYLQQDPLFCDAIAEMCCIVFKVQDLKNTFRRIFKDGLTETAHLIKTDSIEEQQFWMKVFPGKIDIDISDENEFKNSIQLMLDNPIPNYYQEIDFSNLGTKFGIDFLSWLSEIKPLALESLITDDTLIPWHKENLNNGIRNFSKQFEYNLWVQANESDNQELKKVFFKQSIEFDDAVILNSFDNFLNESKYNLSPNYNTAIRDYAESKYGVILKEEVEGLPEILNLYTELFKKYRYGHDIEDMENILKAEMPQIHSLIFFEGNEGIVKAHLDKLEEHNKHSIEGSAKGEEDDELTIINSSLSKAKPSKGGNTKLSGSHSHNSKGDKKKAAVGKRKEKDVVKALTKNGYEVRNIAKKRDVKHYDLEYKKKGCNEWRYLEVKKDSGGFFFLSKAEKETAMMKENREKYDIAIVNDETIHIIEKPFDFQDESFGNNSTFFAEPSEYKISYNINE